MEMTLLLNATYEPLRVVHWQKAIALLWQGKVEVLEVYDREIHAVSISIKLPSVMRLPQAGPAQGCPSGGQILPYQYLHARWLCLPVLSSQVPDRGTDVRSCRPHRQGWAKDLGKYRDGVLAL